jgi:hypothetical protein
MIVCSGAPDFQQRQRSRGHQRPKYDAGRAEYDQSADNRHERWNGVQPQAISHKDRIQHVIDAPDHHAAPHTQDQGLTPMTAGA